MLGEAGKQEILQQMFRKFESSSEQIFSENWRWVPLSFWSFVVVHNDHNEKSALRRVLE